jgi:hypothetical protein
MLRESWLNVTAIDYYLLPSGDVIVKGDASW